MKHRLLTGSITALVTPFHNGKVDTKDLRKLVEFQIKGGINGLVPVGTTGESPTLDHEEHIDVVREVIAASRGRVPVIAGTGSNSTTEAVGLTELAHQAGAEAGRRKTGAANPCLHSAQGTRQAWHRGAALGGTGKRCACQGDAAD